MPKNWFSNLRIAPKFISKEEIIKGETDYILFERIKVIISYLLIPFPIIVVVCCYYFYGRETHVPELESLPPYEREPPSNLSPAEAVYLLLLSKTVPPSAIAGEILWLVQHGYLQMEEITKSRLFGEKKVIGFKPTEKKPENLSKHQMLLYNLITSVNIFIPEEYFTKNLNSYSQLSNIWKAVSERNKMFIDKTGVELADKILSLYIIAALFLSYLDRIFYNFVFIYLAEVICLRMLITIFPQLLGRWAKEGRILEARWKNYKKFMEDLTLMSEKCLLI